MKASRFLDAQKALILKLGSGDDVPRADFCRKVGRPPFGPFERGYSGALKPLARSWNMKKLRYTQKRIAFALKQAERGTTLPRSSARMRVSEQTFYR